MIIKKQLHNDVLSAVEALKIHGTKTKAAKALGIPRTTLNGRLEIAETYNLIDEAPDSYELQDLPSDDYSPPGFGLDYFAQGLGS